MYQIPITLINKSDRKIDLESNDKLFLILVALHYNKIIDDAKLKGKLRSLREGTLRREVNLYHCNINDRWYRDEPMVDILKDVWNTSKQPKQDIPLKQFLIYINKWINKPQNYCVNYCYTQFIKPIVERYEYTESTSYYDFYSDFLKEYGFKMDIVRFEDDYRYVNGYCCEDCSGNYEDYCESQFKYYQVKKNLIEIKEEIFDVLNKFRTKDYLKNPNRVILS